MKKASAPKRADGRYEIKRTIPAEYSTDGKSYRQTFYSKISKQDCINQYNAYLLELGRLHAEGVQLLSAETKFEKWANTWLETYKKGKVKESTYSESYLRTVNRYLIPRFGDCELSKIKPIDVQAYLNQMAQEVSNSTLVKIRLCLNNIFEVAVDNNMIAKNPAKNAKAKSVLTPAKKRTYSQEQYDNIIAFARTHPSGHLIRLLLEVGLRCSEMCGLQFGDIDYDTHTLNLRRSCTTVNYRPFVSETLKNASSKRSLPISSDLCEQLWRVAHEHEVTDFIESGCNSPHTPIYFSSNKYKSFFKDLGRVYADYPELSPHELRHTCGTLLYARSHDIYAVSKYLGHASIDITVKTYVHDSADLLRDHLGIK